MSETTGAPAPLIAAIDAVLPQTQCEECGYPGCLAYATAVVNQQTTIDKCAPGGLATLHELAKLTALDPAPYETTVLNNTRPPTLAVIDEAHCIGCTKCIQACPTDAIIGAAKQMHVILAAECTGCELCVPACPVDCIDLLAIAEPTYQIDKARMRYQAKQQRAAQQLTQQKPDLSAMQARIKAALAEAQSKQNKSKDNPAGPHE